MSNRFHTNIVARLMAIVLAVVLCMPFAACGNRRNGGGDGANDTPTSGLEYTLTQYKGVRGYDVAVGTATSVSRIVIPDSYNSMPVLGIAKEGFKDCEKLTSMYIPESVKIIRDEAFMNCDNLKKVTLPDGLEWVGKDAFFLSYSVKYTKYDNGEYIGSSKNPYFFLADTQSYGSNITTKIHPNTKIIGSDAFSHVDDAQLTSVTIPDGVIAICDDAFRYSDYITRVILPDTLRMIGTGVFYGCDALQYTSNGIGKYIGTASNPYYALVFAANNNFERSFSAHNSTKIIGGDAFYYAHYVYTISIPAGVVGINGNAFCGGLFLETVNYGGTKAQWLSMATPITEYDSSDNFYVQCSDGNVYKSEFC